MNNTFYSKGYSLLNSCVKQIWKNTNHEFKLLILLFIHCQTRQPQKRRQNNTSPKAISKFTRVQILLKFKQTSQLTFNSQGQLTNYHTCVLLSFLLNAFLRRHEFSPLYSTTQLNGCCKSLLVLNTHQVLLYLLNFCSLE